MSRKLIYTGLLGITSLTGISQGVDLESERKLGYYQKIDTISSDIIDVISPDMDSKIFYFREANLEKNGPDEKIISVDTIGLTAEQRLEQYAIKEHRDHQSGKYPGGFTGRYRFFK